ncbi:MAG: dihydroxy-acid dehydratase, partial [Candidatus Omnitrophica bacterium]|nr:dihydroxy-acid dehydratase [Candidatus Omnitrophota bacterium]
VDGDKITINIPKRKINVDLSAQQIKERKKKIKLLASKVKSGYLYRYSRSASSASTGAVYKNSQ